MADQTAEALKPMKATSDGVFQGENPLNSALPLAILQICIVVVLTRVLAFMLRPLRQPRVIAEIIGGILLGPSALGRSTVFLNTVFPKQSLTVLDTLANIGLLYFLFLVGLELDLRAIRGTGSSALVIAVAGISLPFIMGIGTSYVLQQTVARGVPTGPFLVFMGVALSITAFPVLARILAELKLLTTDLGRMAMSAAAVNDVVAWILLALAIALSGSGSPLVSLWGEPVKEIYICATLAIVLAAGFATDTIGIHALFGAFIVGIIVPKEGPFAGVLLEKVEDLISGLFLPLYFVSSGLKTNVMTIKGGESWALLVLVVGTACIGKIGGTLVASLVVRVPLREAVTLGFLMNTKGLVELIVLNIGKDRHVLNDETFAILVLMALITTFITTPVVMATYKPARRGPPYKNRAVERANPNDEFRMMACFHSTRNIPTIINLMESSRGKRKRGITVYAMHLVELSERSSAISMVHKARRNGMPFWNRRCNGDGDVDQLVVAFETYQQLSRVSIRAMTAISDLHTIHEDIVTSAHQKRAALIVLPFHKLHQMDDHMELLGDQYQHINQRVLHHAPCSIGILVDRGLGGAAQVAASDVSYTIVVIFFGGRDDREALAYGMRMVEHPGIALHVLRFSPQTDAGDRATDDAFLEDFRTNVANGNESVQYQEKQVGGKADIVEAFKAAGRCNLFLVGQGAPCTPLTDRSTDDCPELGPVGSYLALPEFSTVASVLVMKQYDPTAKHYDLVEEVAEIAVDVDTPGPSNRGTNTSFRAG
ncbi:cation/H(+) antiporter 19-like [Panicum miliaceum]|uniref:Cation/H(+) antiporter 19-like n=1 Tax=Panicum miliaceum TaxID=4540 RepID=A0A3L6T2Z2_PANMI|nr:cation/H(+) antiporter 19-like [Panicum miliaceum]